MKKTKKVTVTKEVEELVEMRCDVCGAESKYSTWGDSRHFKETTVMMHLGEDYGYNAGGEATITEFDICPKCFSEVIVRALEDKGAKARITEYDY